MCVVRQKCDLFDIDNMCYCIIGGRLADIVRNIRFMFEIKQSDNCNVVVS